MIEHIFPEAEQETSYISVLHTTNQATRVLLKEVSELVYLYICITHLLQFLQAEPKPLSSNGQRMIRHHQR